MNPLALTIGCFLMVVGAITVVRWIIRVSDWLENYAQYHDLGSVSPGKQKELKFGGKKR